MREFDPRREERRQLLRTKVPEGIDARELDPQVRHDLRSLAKDTAELTAQHLIMVGRLIDEDPVQALAHARAATALAGRVAPVREAAGLAAYAAQEWALALSELRTARRISGQPDHLAVLADCERALGRPERALAALDDPDVARLDQASRVELVIVVAGARRDLGELDAAVLLLQVPAQGTKERHPWAARLWYAYADALLAAGRPQAREWFERAAAIDEGETEALDRLLELDGVVFTEGDEPDGADSEAGETDAEASVSLAELGLAPVSAADLPEVLVTTDEPELAALDVEPEADREPEEVPEIAVPEFTAREPEQLDADQGRPAVVAPPVFSHDEEPTPPPSAVEVLGQQELFSDLGSDKD